MRVAFATTDLAHIDGDPWLAPSLMVYDVSEEGVHREGVHDFAGREGERAGVLADCQFVFAGAADAVGAARLRRTGCDLLLSHAGCSVAGALDHLRDRCRSQGSRWLRLREQEARRSAVSGGGG